jgi:chromosome segregation ATPase
MNENDVSQAKKVLLLENAKRKLERLNEDMKGFLSEQPQITNQIETQTNKINELKSEIKKKSDNQLILDEELNKIEKDVQRKQNETEKINKKLIRIKKSFKFQKNKLYWHKKNISNLQIKLYKIKLNDIDQKSYLQRMIILKLRERLQAKIAIEMERMSNAENFCIQKEGEMEETEFNLKNSEKKKEYY